MMNRLMRAMTSRRVSRTGAGCVVAVALLAASPVAAQDTGFQPSGSQIPGPAHATPPPSWMGEMFEWRSAAQADRAAYLRDIRRWRTEELLRIGYTDEQYRRPEFLWTQRNFVQPQMMVEERYFYDPAAGKYTVDRYLDDLDKRYGGIDSVLIWPVYPNIGIDNRNQWDLHRDLPGGIPALREMVADFHRRNVRVFFPAMPWDMGTRDPGRPHAQMTAELMAEIGADGVNGDTFSGLPQLFRTASDATSHPVIFEPELWPASDEGLIWNNQSWGYWKYSFEPTVSKLKWLEPRHLINVCNRWARNKTDDLQFAFFNGVGYESWENIWGIWNQITPRDAEALRRVATVERSFAPLLVSRDWEPFSPMLQYGIFASKFPGQGRTLWTIVNRNEYSVHGEQMAVPMNGRKYYDVWHGVELKPAPDRGDGVLSFDMEAYGFGAILAVDPGAPQADLQPILDKMKQLTGAPLSDYPNEWRFLPQRMVEVQPAKVPPGAQDKMVKVPSGDFVFRVTGVEIEGSNWVGMDVQYPWEDAPRRGHWKRMSISAFYIDKYPVTNAEFKAFLDGSGYRPKDSHNFLKDWSNGTYPAGWAKRPVTWVSIEDARAYATWAGKRLPHEWEWQYAAQGADGRLYPWGNDWDPAAVPATDKGRDLRGPDEVDAHPSGASPFGVMDLVGNVWQYTDEYVDEHTRAAVLRGGSYYQPQGSLWYFPQTYKLDQHGKYLLMAPSKDRAGTLGFRCAADAQ